MSVRKFHRAFALFFSPFLITTAVTGLLWAYAPYLYWKPEPPKEKQKIRASSVTLYSAEGEAVRTIMFSPQGDKEVLVDENGIQFQKPKVKYPVFHQWVMRIHRLEFFGTKKELVIFPGTGLLLMLFTGFFLFKRGLK